MMSEDERDLLEFQERFIIRLRAALLTLGCTAEEVTRIAQDTDGQYTPIARLWERITA